MQCYNDIDEFLDEAAMLHGFRHRNVMGMLGVCLEIDEMPLVCLEYMHHGDLRSYLRKMRGSCSDLLDHTLATVSLLCIALQLCISDQVLSPFRFLFEISNPRGL